MEDIASDIKNGHSDFCKSNRKRAFTLAETVVSLTIIGVLAVLTVPSMVHEWKNVRYATAYKKLNATIVNGFSLMIAQGTISGYNSTEDFVQNMDGYFNISKICTNNDLSGCFSSKISTLDGTVKLSDIKKASNLGRDWATDTNVNGVVFSDGTSMLIAYNRDGCSTTARGRDAIIASCVAIAYDLDGADNHGKYVPNEGESVKGMRDIGVLNARFVPDSSLLLASSGGYGQTYGADTYEGDTASDYENNAENVVENDDENGTSTISETPSDEDENNDEVPAENTSETDKNCKVDGRPCTLVEYLYYLLTSLIDAVL